MQTRSTNLNGVILFFTKDENSMPEWINECNESEICVLIENIQGFIYDREMFFLNMPAKENINLIVIEDDSGIFSLKLLKSIKSQGKFKNTPVIFIGKYSEKNKIEVLKMGALDYLQEPVESRELVLKTRVIMDIYDRYLKETIFDSLTEVYSNKYGEQLLLKEIRLAVKNNLKLSILAIDIDGLSDINKVKGKKIGDEIIKSIIEIFKENLESRDFIFRVSGGKFITVFPDRSPLYVLKLSDTLLMKVKLLSRVYDVDIRFTGNVKEIENHVCKPEHLLLPALTGLKEVKNMERGKVYINNDQYIRPKENSILIVNEEEEFLFILSKRYYNKGFQVYTANDVQSLLENLKNNYIDIVLTDYTIIGMNGNEIISHVKGVSRNTKVMVLTHQKSETMIEKIFKAGADDYLMKPASPVELDSRINRLLRR